MRKILVANRGEIALRVMKSAQKMGIKTVAIYSTADRNAPHVKFADEAVCIGEAPSNQSYLLGDKIIETAKSLNVDGIHPGYGFLSENAKFAKAVTDSGIKFIGPKPHAIEIMGSKLAAKEAVKAYDIPMVPGIDEAITDTEKAKKIAKEIGFPILIKASAGGGGKGMRVVESDEVLEEQMKRAISEAESAFGDGSVFIEKYVASPRHIEIQVLADEHGNTVHLFERECSIQRRHQKVVEEAPSVVLDNALRKEMGEAAVRVAKACDYVGAGTVEFLFDESRNFYFLEMNTRLQVEHPVTEFVTGQDLVEHMIRVADNEVLSLTQKDVKVTGWAMETRVYAEDPFRNFLPSIGRLVKYTPPMETKQVRVDTGIEEGSEVSMFYDPMIAKLITYGEDREQAIDCMADALDAYYIRGVSHNISFLNALIMHPRFREGRLTTNFIAEEYPDGFHAADVPQSDPLIPVALAALVNVLSRAQAGQISGQAQDFERQQPDHWVVIANKAPYPVSVQRINNEFAVTHLDQVYRISMDWQFGQVLIRAEVNGAPVTVQLEPFKAGYRAFFRGAETILSVLTPRAAALLQHMIEKQPPDLSKFLLSPMPGLLVRLTVAEGDEVKAGEELAVIEAMKMENSLRAEEDGIVAKVMAAEGDSLMVDQAILEFE